MVMVFVVGRGTGSQGNSKEEQRALHQLKEFLQLLLLNGMPRKIGGLFLFPTVGRSFCEVGIV